MSVGAAAAGRTMERRGAAMRKRMTTRRTEEGIIRATGEIDDRTTSFLDF